MTFAPSPPRRLCGAGSRRCVAGGGIAAGTRRRLWWCSPHLVAYPPFAAVKTGVAVTHVPPPVPLGLVGVCDARCPFLSPQVVRTTRWCFSTDRRGLDPSDAAPPATGAPFLLFLRFLPPRSSSLPFLRVLTASCSSSCFSPLAPRRWAPPFAATPWAMRLRWNSPAFSGTRPVPCGRRGASAWRGCSSRWGRSSDRQWWQRTWQWAPPMRWQGGWRLWRPRGRRRWRRQLITFSPRRGLLAV